jgi:hypothetical protein
VSLEDIFQKNIAFYVNLSLQNKTYQQSRTGSHQAIFYKVRIKKANAFIYKQLARFAHSDTYQQKNKSFL